MMFNVQLGDQKASFTFQHIRGIGEEVKIKAATTCTLIIDGRTHTGIAACSVKDNFEREKGRKVALANALQMHKKDQILPYDFRRVIWDRYHARGVPNDSYEHVTLAAKGFVEPQPLKVLWVKK